MFRKIHSNRDPQATVFGELRNEFRPYVDKMQHGLKRIADSYPRFLFIMMVINIILSIVLVMTVFKRKGDPPKPKIVNAATPLTGGFNRIRETGLALKETIRLKRGIDSLTHLKTLSKADSAQLLKDLDSLRHIQFTQYP
ncbi:MAG: hypothetical protein JST32_01790 [Bacteroidetes bacterium]|nr:hypothetical protein [Bacteroidota bacterium]